ncbi:uncharacterized protein DSM5745_03025 [Aspergillus mulundensis]|uniref:Impact N-terminal domain-containing protein n=1 Tax=Aspergillus mulundensis TaxID=1810919 RepID=A0A3D8SJ98_9EURO|nr:Uncharacterized protein DSM5745_03025 [Aspergillus mulundensis]RDW86383.1 Uncharacterized protein DSM5745_03025 [Aspergillus mulundensis]
MAASQVQSLLRFLSQDAKVPLATAMSKVNELRKADLTTAQTISNGELKTLQEIFKDDKLAKQVLNAARRTSKKRSAPTESTGNSRPKKSRPSLQGGAATPFAIESALALPVSTASEEELSNIVLLTNRAPLVLAFAVCVLKYTMPEQPLSSRLSLAQAVVSANSRSKAVSLGLEGGKSAEQEGWGEGQPTVSVLNRDIKVLKRWDYNPREGRSAEGFQDVDHDILGEVRTDDSETAPPLWGIDVEALKHAESHGSEATAKTNTALPIYTPQSARSYLFKSFLRTPSEAKKESTPPKTKSPTQVEVERGVCLGYLLRSIDLLCQSWAPTLSADDLDRRAWAWYVRVRPSVHSGIEGWGEKGAVKLSEILALRRQS